MLIELKEWSLSDHWGCPGRHDQLCHDVWQFLFDFKSKIWIIPTTLRILFARVRSSLCSTRWQSPITDFFFGQCFVIRLFPALLWWNCLYISALFSMLWWLWELVKSFFLHRVQQHGLVQWHPLSNCLIFQLLLLRMHRQERQWYMCTKHESRE